ncbi:glycosyltransferase family 2 protein [Niabella defluvii]|nr:glycosyltransferase family 2 protein [Niabella sp. I65]
MDNECTIVSEEISPSFTDLRVCVIIPTYNNVATIATVITDILKYTSNIIVVNDGSTDDTANIISAFEGVAIESYQPNRGKGMALRRGFKKAIEMGYDYAVTIDSDGQHFAKDLPVLLKSYEMKGLH